MESPPFAIGQEVFWAEASPHGRINIPCPVCFGERFVTLILGNGEHQPVECEACGLGFEGPRGVVCEYAPISQVSSGVVDGLEWDGYKNRWRTSVGGFRREHVFNTRDEAEAKRVELHAEASKLARKMFEDQMNGKKKHLTWSAHYHRSELRQIEAKAEHHRRKLADPRIRERKPKEAV